jgi:phosphate-selective porin OprO/OprP
MGPLETLPLKHSLFSARPVIPWASALLPVLLTASVPALAQTGTAVPPATPTPPPLVDPAPAAPAPAPVEPAPAPATAAPAPPGAAPAGHPIVAPPVRPLDGVPPTAAPPATASRPDTKPGDAPRLEISAANGAHQLRIAAVLQADLRSFFADSGVTTFAIRRARPILEGKVFRYYEFRLQTDFAAGRLQLLDAYGNLHFLDEVQLLVGKAKGPIVLERLQSPQNVTFAERGFPSQLGPNRDIGAKLHGKLLVGVYNGVPNGSSGDLDTNDAKDVEGRLFLSPFTALDVKSLDLGFGAAAAIGDQQSALPTYVTPGQQPFFAYGTTATAFGRRTLVSPQGYFYAGPVGILSELVRVREHVVSTSGATGTVGSTAFQVAGSVVIGGKPSYKGVKVENPLDPEAGTFGAFELAARYHSLRVGDLAYRRGFANRSSAATLARAFTVGANWHLATGQRALVNYERTTFRGGAANRGNRKPESVLITRLQASF